MKKTPEVVFLNISNHCPLSCLHCYFDSGEPLVGELDADQWKIVIHRLAAAGVRQIKINGGEPGSSPCLQPVIAEAQKLGLASSVTTNGQVLDENRLQHIAKNSAIHFSLDGATAETHDFLRDFPGAFEKNIASIKTVTAVRDDVRCFVTIGTHNAHEISKIVQLVDDLGISLAAFFHLSPFGRAVENKALVPSPQGWQQCLKALTEAVELIRPKTKIFTEPVYNIASLGPCGIDRRHLCSIDALGNAYPCSALIDGTGRFALGNLLDSELQAIWNDSSAWERLRKARLAATGKTQQGDLPCAAILLRGAAGSVPAVTCFMHWEEVTYD